MARTNPLDLLRTAAREGVHAGVTVGGKALGHAATLAHAGLVRGQAAVTAATARRRQPTAPPASRPHVAPAPVEPVETVGPQQTERAATGPGPAPESGPATAAPPKSAAKKPAAKKSPPRKSPPKKSAPASDKTASSAPSPTEVAKRAQPRPTARPPAKKAARTAPSGPGAKLPPRREAEQD